MKRFWIWILASLAILAALDALFGVASRWYVKNHVIPGDYRSLDYLLKESTDDVMVTGSSVALNSINTATLADSMGTAVYNAASNGQTLTYQLALLKSILKRHTPSTVMLGLYSADFVDRGAGARINLLAPYYGFGYQAIDSVLETAEPQNRWALKSNFYRLNTIWFRILLYNFVEPGVKGRNGFIAKDIPPVFPERMKYDYRDLSTEGRPWEQLNEYIALCRSAGVKLIIFFPPVWFDPAVPLAETPVFDRLSRLAASSGVALWNDAEHPRFASDSTLFFNANHLNYRGADIYTSIILDRLRDMQTPDGQSTAQ